MELNLLYVHALHMGYGRMGTYIHRELNDMGVTVYDDLPAPPGGNIGVVTMRSPVIEEAPQDRRSGRSNIACWISTPSHGTGWWKGQTACVYTMWEAMRLPEAFRESLHHFDTVIVPSMQNVELMSQFHGNVKYVPLGVDPQVWHYRQRPEVGRFFNFLCAGSGNRKGVDLVVRAFQKLWGKDGSWGSGPVPMLILKNPKGDTYYGDRIQVHSGRLTDQEEVDLYGAAHCYVQPSRGEGFGLQPLQAMAQGIPTILTNAHGHESFARYGLPLDWKPKKSDYFIFGDAGEWWEPDFDQLCDAMQTVYRAYEFHRKRAADYSDVILDTFTWRNTAEGLLDALGRDRLGPYEGPEEWQVTDPKRFKVITNQNWWSEIAGASMYFERGVPYYALADVKRILFEAGVLDPACLDDDDPEASGLTLEQIAKAGKYRAEHSKCPTCHRPLDQ